MFKRTGLIALLLAGIGAAMAPQAASAQQYYGDGYSGHYQRDRDFDRRQAREWREREKWERRREENRERFWRDEARREQWRSGYRWDERRGYRCPPGNSFYFGFRN